MNHINVYQNEDTSTISKHKIIYIERGIILQHMDKYIIHSDSHLIMPFKDIQ